MRLGFGFSGADVATPLFGIEVPAGRPTVRARSQTFESATLIRPPWNVDDAESAKAVA